MGFELGDVVGFVFSPTDTDLLKYFLKPKINGEEVSCNFIVEKQIYGANCNPWDVLDSSTPWIASGKSKKIAYVFTRLNDKAPLVRSSVVGNKSLSGSGSGVQRRKQYVKLGGCGSWNGLTGRMPIKDNNKNVLGIRRVLNFQINDVSGALRNNFDFTKLGHYKLDEFVLAGCHDYALCRITLDTSKTPMVVNLQNDDVSNIICSMQSLNVLGKRKSFQAQDCCSGPTKLLCT
ncbi:hypothetical protein POM88_035499 [Heracleum sosnowskyi]|uniref:NAC domain-containing protein n=1 Tax=Heracleum sosnowskyi TaxID=360622 RepID=A0AAD8ME17_9APIA|nr:hypothetical protein POM88_035499 [Heracleum sosnowskyi]